MSVAKLSGTNTPDSVISDEETDTLDTFIRQPVGNEPLYFFPITADGPTQWIQLIHTFDQKGIDFSGWSLLAPMKVQMQKCDKCACEFCSTINYRRHIRVHRRFMNFHKDPQKFKDILGAFWDKLDYDKVKEILSLKDVNIEEVSGSSIVNDIAVNLRNLNFLSLPQVYVKAGSELVDIIQCRLSSQSISSSELFSILDDASERTFLCAGTPESLKKYIFEENGKISLETKNLIACTSFIVEQKLVDAWFADKDAEALRCQKLLVEEEEAAQKRQAELLERKRQRKIRQKEQRAKYQSESDTSAVNSNRQISSVIDSIIPDENIITPIDPIQLPRIHDDGDNQTTLNSCQLMIGSISVTVRNRTGQYQVNSPVTEFQESENVRGQLADGSKSQIMEEDVTLARDVDQTLTTESSQQSCESNVNDEDTSECSEKVESGEKIMRFCVDAARDFFSRRWKEAISRDHVLFNISTHV